MEVSTLLQPTYPTPNLRKKTFKVRTKIEIVTKILNFRDISIDNVEQHWRLPSWEKKRSKDRIQDTQGIPKMTKAWFLNVHNTWHLMKKVVFSLHLKHTLQDDKKMLTKGLESPPSPRAPVRCCGGNVIKWDGLISTECAQTHLSKK